MSTVLWVNVLDAGKVVAGSEDKYALYRHVKKLDRLTRKLQLPAFSSALDYTDVKFNLGNEDLPAGMESTDELMAINGTWMTGGEAVRMLENLIAYIAGNNVRFGLIGNDCEEVLEELKGTSKN